MSKTDISKVIISGDWNITLNRIDKLRGLPWKPTGGRNILVDLMEELNLTRGRTRELIAMFELASHVCKVA